MIMFRLVICHVIRSSSERWVKLPIVFNIHSAFYARRSQEGLYSGSSATRSLRLNGGSKWTTIVYFWQSIQMFEASILDASNRKSKNHARRSCAWAFLVLMLCQIGSHAAIDSHGHGGFEHPVSVLHLENDHHDYDHHEYDHHECDCNSAIDCTDDQEHDDQLPILQDENNHHHVLAAGSIFRFLRDRRSSQRLTFDQAILHTRSQAPPVLPPKHS